MSDLTVHPVADLFPMLADDELSELAADIKQRGLIQPIVLDADGRVLDGRNRLAACELAGVDPTFTTYDGDDPDGYALAVNIARRHMTKGQLAIVAAKAAAFFKKTVRSVASEQGISAARVGYAATILDHAPDLAARVLDATMPLNDAYDVARQRKRAAEDARGKLDRLRAGAPDLASHVDDERMSLDDAIAALDAREEKTRREEEERRTAVDRDRRLREQERKEALERDRDRVRSVITGWPTVRDIILPDPDGEHSAEIVAGLGESDHLALKRIITELKG